MPVKPAPVKRANGTKWRVRFRLEGDANATSETFSTYEAAERFIDLGEKHTWAVARTMRHGAERDTLAIPTLATHFETHLKRLAAARTPGTIEGYRSEARRSWLPRFGHYPLDMITRDMIIEWVGWQRQQETQPSERARAKAIREGRPQPEPQLVRARTIEGYQRLLSSVLNSAVEDGILVRNVARGIALPSDDEDAEMVFLTTAEMSAILAQTPEAWKPLVALMAGTGLRWSEATALRSGDFDLDAAVPTVRVSRAWKRDKKVKGGAYLGSPKSKAGKRTVSLAPTTVRIVRASVEKAKGEQLVFQSSQGNRVRAQNFHPRVWHPAVIASGVEKRPRVHDLRHSHISHLIAQGVPLNVIQKRAGHEKITTTVDTYGHLMPDALADVALAAEFSLVGPPRPEVPQIEA